MEESSLQSDYSRATRIVGECLRCEKPLAGRQEKYCSNSCRWKSKNEARLRVMTRYWEG
jgi:hypothetical protein